MSDTIDRSGAECAGVQDLLPEWAAGRLDAPAHDVVVAHLDECGECAATARLVASLREARSEPPPGLSARIREAISEGRSPSLEGTYVRGGWALAASIVLVLAGSLVLRPGADVASGDVLLSSLDAAPTVWIEGSTVAGAPMLDELSDEALASLLQELGG